MKLADYLAQTGQSQKSFARDHGLDQSLVCKYIQRSEPGLRAALTIVQATGGRVGLLDLLHTDGKPVDDALGTPFAPEFPLVGRDPAARTGRRAKGGA